jgi:opacity protein-like surface antigen
MSSEEQFEHIEHKIKEAAENNQIVFEETAWAKMEVLLDKEDKQRPFFWLWFLLPIAMVSVYGLFTLSKNNDKAIAKNINENTIEKISTNTKATIQIPTNEQQISAVDNAQIPDDNTSKINNSNEVESTISSQNKNIYTAIKKNHSSISSFRNSAKLISNNGADEAAKNYASQNKINHASKTKATIQNADVSEEENVFGKTEIAKENNPLTQKINIEKAREIKKDSNTSITKNAISKKDKKKTATILSRLYVLGALGADIGSVKLFSFANSSFSTKYGAGIGFDITQKLSVQAGLYTSKKKYIAGPADYNVKAGSYWSTVPITKVEAMCLIYEVPIALQYHIIQKKSFSVYVGAGVSSYIMETEDYNYFYKRYNMEYSKANTYTGNQHLFSTALLSAGVEKNITKNLTLQLEPTISIPLKGIGDGEVRLFSTALLIGVKFSPFNK